MAQVRKMLKDLVEKVRRPVPPEPEAIRRQRAVMEAAIKAGEEVKREKAERGRTE